jgi:hypothetical protein
VGEEAVTDDCIDRAFQAEEEWFARLQSAKPGLGQGAPEVDFEAPAS